MKLNELHNRLYSHYRGLHEQKKKNNYSVFAFEHGLASAERDELILTVHVHLRSSAPDERYWLPWVVYATEIGYEFDGREYWDSFESKTPNWRSRGNRHFIRDNFEKFVQSFGGFKPSGVWANHFNIISYPITHAILPRDLQYKLSRVLFDLRSYVNRTLIQTPRLLGKHIFDHSYYETKRFQQFAQNYELIGLIAREILTIDDLGSNDAILPATFQRIISDLRKQRDAATLVDQARSVLKSRTNVSGRVVRNLEPQLMLRRVENRNWDVFLEIPSLAPIAEKSEEAEKFLRPARPRINGCLTGKRLATGMLLMQGSVLRQLKSVPADNEQIINFQRELPPELENFFKKDFVLDLPKATVFNVESNGMALRHKSNVVRPENSYIILCRKALRGNELLKSLQTSCTNVYLYSLSSENLSARQHRDLLREIDLEIEADFRLVPVGLPPLKWDEGHSVEYLDGEAPCFMIKINRSWHEIKIQLEDFDELEINNPTGADHAYFGLPVLPFGLYKLSCDVQYDIDSGFETLSSISIGVKDQLLWQPGSSSQNALLLLSDPPKPTYEQLFNGKVSFEIYSPETSIDVCLSLLSKNPVALPLIKKHIIMASLPRDIKKINAEINKAVEDSQLLETFELAHLCCLEFKSDELGSIRLDFRREFSPIQWEVKTDRSDGVILNLSDEAFGDEETKVYHYKFEKPDSPIELNFSCHFPDYCVPETGGLFAAVTPKQRKGIVVLKTRDQTTFRNFAEIGQTNGFDPIFRNYDRTEKSLAELIDLYCLWNNSRIVGSVFSKKDLQTVLDGILLKICCLIGDSAWKNLELNYCRNPNDVYAKESLIKAISSKSYIQSGLKRLNVFDRSSEELVEDLAEIFKSEVKPEHIRRNLNTGLARAIIKVLRQDWFAEFALRLCSHPETLKEWALSDEKYKIGLKKLLSTPSLTRAARFIALNVGHDAMSNTRYYKWDWE